MYVYIYIGGLVEGKLDGKYWLAGFREVRFSGGLGFGIFLY